MDTQEKQETTEDIEITFEKVKEITKENLEKDKEEKEIFLKTGKVAFNQNEESVSENKRINEETKRKLDSDEEFPDLEYGIRDRNAKIDEELKAKRKEEINIFRNGTDEEICELIKKKTKESEDGFRLLLESSPRFKDIVMNQMRLNDKVLEKLNFSSNEELNEDYMKEFKEIMDRYSS